MLTQSAKTLMPVFAHRIAEPMICLRLLQRKAHAMSKSGMVTCLVFSNFVV